MICKFQKPISPPDGPVLIYNQDESFLTHVPFSMELQELFGHRLKFYAACDLRPNGDGSFTVVINREVEAQEW